MDKNEARLTRLRERATLILEGASPALTDGDSDFDTVVQELRIHQVELELQLEEIKQAYLALESSQQRSARLFENAPIAYFILNPSGWIANANIAAHQLLGQDGDELKGRLFAEFIAPAFQDVYHFYWRAVQNEQNKQSCEVELQTNNGMKLPVLLNASMQGEDSKDLLLAVSNLAMVKQSDETLARASEHSKELAQMRLNLLSVIAPEFRRPLASILSSFELLHKQGKRLTEKKRNQLYHSIRNLTLYLNDTIQDARKLKELAADQRLRLESFELLAFTQQVIHDIAVVADGQKIAFEIPTDQDQLNIVWNRNLYRRIVMNLLGSLLKFTNSSIRCELDVHDTTFTLCFDIQSSRLSEGELELLFEAFHEGRNTEFVQGRGNGLFLAYLTIQSHGGSIRHKSHEAGGIRFLIELPKRQAPSSPYRH